MTELEPVVLHEDEQTGDRFLVYGTDAGLRVEISYTGDKLWMTQAQIAELFGREVSTISRHISNIAEEGELGEETFLQKTQISSGGRPIALYSLDMVISVGYRVSSAKATLFRRWATDKLVQFATKGFVVDSTRLKEPEQVDRLRELREIIRDIRSDEANVYRELRQICSMCQDYEGGSIKWQEFYKNTQAKIVYAVTSHTPAELIRERSDGRSENAGLTNWPNANIRKSDVSVSKNYLGQQEIKELNRLTTIFLDIFEDQADIGRLVIMDDARKLLDEQIRFLKRPLLRGGGQVAMADAKQHAERQYEIFAAQRKAVRLQQGDDAIRALTETSKALPKAKPGRTKPS